MNFPSAEGEVDYILLQASCCMNFVVALQLYYRAIELCKLTGLKEKEAVIHSILSDMFLQNDVNLAIKEATEAILLDPTNGRGFACRAAGYITMADTYGMIRNRRMAKDYYSKSIKDYKQCFKASRRIDAICEALNHAVNYDLTDLLQLEAVLTRFECIYTVQHITKNPPWANKHIDYLVRKSQMPGSGVAIVLSCNLSSIMWSDVLKKADVKCETVQAISALGGKFCAGDIYTIVEMISEAKLQILRFALESVHSSLRDREFKKMFDRASALKKFKFVGEILKYSPSLFSQNSSALVELMLKQRNFDFVADKIAEGMSVDTHLIVKAMNRNDISKRESKILTHLRSTLEGQVQLFMKAVSFSEIEMAEAMLKKKSVDANKLCLSSILKFQPRGSTDERKNFIRLIERLLQAGIDSNKKGGDKDMCPLDVVLELSKDYEEEKIELLTLLIEHHADIGRCTYQKKNQTTLLHIAAKWAIQSDKNLRFLEVVCEHYPYEDQRIQDKKGDNPYHIVMERKCSPCTIKTCQILSRFPINPSPNYKAKKPGEWRSKEEKLKDERYDIMQKASTKFQSAKKKNQRKSKKPKEDQVTTTENAEICSEALPAATKAEVPSTDKDSAVDQVGCLEDVLMQVKDLLSQLSNKPSSYFEPPINYKRHGSLPQSTTSEPQPKGKFDSVVEGDLKMARTADAMRATIPTAKYFDELDLAWEVECTEKVKRFFVKTKVPRSEKEMVVKTVQKLAYGIPLNNQKLCKEIRGTRSKLFESHYTKGSRIIFEVAVQFSPRLSSGNKYIYSEVIRLWDIVRDHDKLNRSIDHAVESIKKSQSKGETAAKKTPLRMDEATIPRQSTANQERVRLPQIYECSESQPNNEYSQIQVLDFFPAGSTRDDEYNVITFYSFNSSFVKTMLDGEHTRRDFPFKEWPKEHDIINMPQGAVSILLLGRSGTGKTTCCLYRLWNQFQMYWAQAIHSGKLLEHRPLTILQDKEQKDEEVPDCRQEDEEVPEEDEEVPDYEEDSDKSTELPPISITGNSVPSEHFHQVFITKNYVLCAQMKKRFYDLVAGKDIETQHMSFEDATLPNSLSEIEDLAYPLFLTARQFFVLLDNSFDDGKNFFSRDTEGRLAEKIVSSDYDHEDPDTLLDLEESDSDDDLNEGSDFDDDEIVESRQSAHEKKKIPPRTEITASYFVEKIWPEISKHVDSKIDPLLVWMEIKSFIKGSAQAVESEGGHLTLGDYENLGRKMASNFEDRRHDIYKIFELYKNYVLHRCEENVFDECDLNFNIYSRLNALRDLPWSIHSIYIDEVQDFTQAELSILIRICRDPNNLFLTGDTAQSIMRGIAFRFGDVTTIFHHASQRALKTTKAPQINVPKVNKLEINFRSHTGVLKLAASIIDLMKHFFPSSFDCLPGDEGMFPGPTPIVLDSCQVSDLALVLRTNKRESSTIEFGAHQVIIVQSEEAKKNIPDVLKAGIVLTVFESKGLEFDDVLLYDFFKDSKVGKDWRVVTSYIEDSSDKVVNSSSQFKKEPRRLEFDKTQHKSLNAELKYLYTAVTRAKCNLWIYDTDEDKRLPVFNYWSKRGLVRVICVSDITTEDQKRLFLSTSSEEEWKTQGDYFKKKKLWEPAMKCYQRAGCLHLESEARAYSLAQQAHSPGLSRTEIQEIYLKSAHAFLMCDQSQHDYQHLENAAKCLKNAKKYSESALLYHHLQQDEKALKIYKRCKDVKGLAKLKERKGDHDGIIRLFLRHNRIIDAIKWAEKCEAGMIQLQDCHRVKILAGDYAEKSLQSGGVKNHTEFVTVIKYLPPLDQVEYLKAVALHKEACEILERRGKHKELYRIYKAQGWHNEGLQLSKKRNHSEATTDFLIFKTTSEIGSLEESTEKMLKNSWGRRTEKEAKFSLVYGMATNNSAKIKVAYTFYTGKRHVIGSVEALNIAFERMLVDEKYHFDDKEKLLDQALRTFKEIRILLEALKAKEPTAAQKSILDQMQAFYGLEKKALGKNMEDYCYFVPLSSFPWTNELLKKLPKKRRDADGMLQFEVEQLHKAILARLNSFTKKWIVEDDLKLVDNFFDAFVKHPIYHLIECNGYLKEMLNYRGDSYFSECLKMLNTAFDIAKCGNKKNGDTEKMAQAVVDILSPQATCYLQIPSAFSPLSSQLAEMLYEMVVCNVIKEKDDSFSLDDWMKAWRVNCITRRSSQMKTVLHSKSSAKNAHKEQHSAAKPPPVYVHNSKKEYQHLMHVWIEACDLMVHEKKMFASSTITVRNIIRCIASEKKIWNTASISNFLNIVTVHTTALLTMKAAVHTCLFSESHFYLPSSYKNVTSALFAMNAGKHIFYRACLEDIRSRNNENRLKTSEKVSTMLHFIMKVIIGIHKPAFNPLHYAVSSEKCLKNHEAHHFLVFVLTLFCNFGLTVQFSDDQLRHYRNQIYRSMKDCEEPTLREACNRFATSRTIAGCFGIVRELLQASKDNFDHIHLFFNHSLKNIEIMFKQADFQNAPQRELLPIEVEPAPKASNPITIHNPEERNPVNEQNTPQEVNPGFETQDSIEPNDDDDDEIAEALKSSQVATKSQQIIEKDPMVDDSLFCLACVCQLKQDGEADANMEPYTDHCLSEEHIRNSKISKCFDSDEKEVYNPLRKELTEVSSKCEELYKVLRSDELQIFNIIRKELDDIDDRIKKIRGSGEWRQGVTFIQNDILEKLYSLQKRAIELAGKGEERVLAMKRDEEEQKRKEEEEERQEEQQPDVDDFVVDSKSGEVDKKKKRARKQKKRKKRST